MERIKPHIKRTFLGVIAFIFLLSMLSADFHDPTVFNQLYPSGGIQNLIGLSGALIGGSLLEIFGPSALLSAWLFVRIPLHRPRRVSGVVGTYYAFMLILLLSILHEFALSSGILRTEDWGLFGQSGYAGRLAIIWLEQTLGVALGSASVIGMLILSVVRTAPVLSPLPLFFGLLKMGRQLIRLSASKILHPPTTQLPASGPLPPFKGRSRIQKNTSGRPFFNKNTEDNIPVFAEASRPLSLI